MDKNVSVELKEKILSYYEENKEDLLNYARSIHSERRYLTFPVIIGGVMDWIRFDTEENCFVGITISATQIADAPSVGWVPLAPFYNGAVMSEKATFVTIPLA